MTRQLTGLILMCFAATAAEAAGGASTRPAAPGAHAQLPEDVRFFIARAQQCAAERPQSAAESWVAHERCMMLPEEQTRLQRRYARNREILSLIRGIGISRY